MPEKSQIQQTIFRAIDQLNAQAESPQPIEKSDDAILFGKGGALDSLGLVNLIVNLEQELGETFGVFVNLADEKAMSRRNSPFRTIGLLTDYVDELIRESAEERRCA